MTVFHLQSRAALIAHCVAYPPSHSSMSCRAFDPFLQDGEHHEISVSLVIAFLAHTLEEAVGSIEHALS